MTGLFKKDTKYDVFRHIPFFNEFFLFYHDRISPGEPQIFSNLTKNLFLSEIPSENAVSFELALFKNAKLLSKEARLAVLSEVCEKYRENLSKSAIISESLSKCVDSFAKSFITESLLKSSSQEVLWKVFLEKKPFPLQKPFFQRKPFFYNHFLKRRLFCLKTRSK